MADVPTPLPPGGMTVPPWHGWETLALAVVLLLVAGAVFLVLMAAVRGGSARRDEWRDLLAARGSRGGEPPDGRPGVPRQPLDVPSR
jgi:hypothetical protein